MLDGFDLPDKRSYRVSRNAIVLSAINGTVALPVPPVRTPNPEDVQPYTEPSRAGQTPLRQPGTCGSLRYPARSVSILAFGGRNIRKPLPRYCVRQRNPKHPLLS